MRYLFTVDMLLWLLMLLLFLILGTVVQHTLTEQNRRAAWDHDCSQRGGVHIHFSKSQVSEVCVGPDGRWLKYY